MNKSELIELIAQDADLSKAAAARALDSVVDNITKAVAAGDSVTLVGFGAFKATKRAAREGKNPKTGEKLVIPEATVPKFSAGAAFKSAVAKK
ncbi:HU family DNA-binding protein [Propionivibrio dicarboxylicus]|uniref:DNA-binding protein HU-beta n=1 Tax=Propionivibrio dicarboxylicus TaxID=83767 RepID=A0A1G7WI79_9RHOO|nr:HU family DNA-binding protein [Propionivibrio dicarboxylicus]SDG71683.1 DNA-binding protein HU-beta [Propionivibrio dicarboxylicus]